MKFETLILLLLMILSVHSGNGAHRRILHQPLFPESSYPLQLPLPPPDNSGVDTSDQPFFPEYPYGGTQYQAPPPPSIDGSMPISSTTTTTTTITTTRAPTMHPTKTIRRAAIAISIGIVALRFLSTLSFFIYRKKVKNRAEKQKTNGVLNPNPPRSNGDGSRAPPSNFLYMETIEPHNQRSNKLSSVKKQDRYRPSNVILSSSDDEGLDDIKHAIIPSIKKTPPPQEAPRMKPLSPEKMNRSVFELQSSLPRRANVDHLHRHRI